MTIWLLLKGAFFLISDKFLGIKNPPFTGGKLGDILRKYRNATP